MDAVVRCLSSSRRSLGLQRLKVYSRRHWSCSSEGISRGYRLCSVARMCPLTRRLVVTNSLKVLLSSCIFDSRFTWNHINFLIAFVCRQNTRHSHGEDDRERVCVREDDIPCHYFCELDPSRKLDVFFRCGDSSFKCQHFDHWHGMCVFHKTSNRNRSLQ